MKDVECRWEAIDKKGLQGGCSRFEVNISRDENLILYTPLLSTINGTHNWLEQLKCLDAC
jgi:hypothetical protein